MLETDRNAGRAGNGEPIPRLSVVVPVYNERYLVAELLRRLAAAPIPSAREVEIIVVDDGSTDGSPDIVRRIAPEIDGLRLTEQPENRGKGAAVRTGIAAAGGDLIVFQDADLEYHPRDLARLARRFVEDGAEVVYGSGFRLPSRTRKAWGCRSRGGILSAPQGPSLRRREVGESSNLIRQPLERPEGR